MFSHACDVWHTITLVTWSLKEMLTLFKTLTLLIDLQRFFLCLSFCWRFVFLLPLKVYRSSLSRAASFLFLYSIKGTLGALILFSCTSLAYLQSYVTLMLYLIKSSIFSLTYNTIVYFTIDMSSVRGERGKIFFFSSINLCWLAAKQLSIHDLGWWREKKMLKPWHLWLAPGTNWKMHW